MARINIIFISKERQQILQQLHVPNILPINSRIELYLNIIRIQILKMILQYKLDRIEGRNVIQLPQASIFQHMFCFEQAVLNT